MEENELYDRIGESDLNPNYKDGQVYQHEDVNNMISIFKTAINANYHDIQKLENGETNVGSAGSVDGATVSRYLDEELQADDNKVPSSQQAKAYMDNLFAEYSAPVRGVDYWTDEDKQEIIDDTSTVVLENINGKNLFDGLLELGNYSNSTGLKFDANNLYRNTNPIPVKPNTTYTFSINGVSQKYCTYYYGNNGTFITYDTSLTTGTFTTPANCYYVNFRCFGGDFTSDFANLKIQLELGDTATNYEPYRKLIKEENGYVKENTTFYANDFKCRNLFNRGLARPYVWLAANGNISSDTDPVITSNFIKVENGKQYTLSGIPDNYPIRVCSYTDINKFKTCLINYTTITKTFIADANYIVFAVGIPTGGDATILSSIQLEIGEATPYTPYNKPVMETNIGVKEDTTFYANDFKCKNLCNGINQSVFLTSAVNSGQILSGNTGLYIKVNGGNYTISTTTNQARYRVACMTAEPSETAQTAYNGVNKDGTSDTITINTSGYNYLIVNATDLTKIQIEVGSEATPYTPYKNFDNTPYVLWTNSNTGVAFDPQDVNISNLSDYKYYEIIYKLHATQSDYYQTSGKIPTGLSTCIGGGYARVNNTPRFWSRYVTYTDTKLTFTTGYYSLDFTNNANTANDILVPYQIIGYK